MLDVIDYGGGNTGSLTRALGRLEAPFRRAGTPETVAEGRPLLLPGVGSFGAVMEGLKARGLVEPIREAILAGRPFLGICVGLQILFGSSEESPSVPGLDVFQGRVVRFRAGKIPQIGWNRVEPRGEVGFPGGFAYFVNSFVAAPADKEIVLYESDYFGPFCAAVQKGNVTAFQFHPEKSGGFGHGLLRRWIDAL